MKKIMLFAVACVALAACSKDMDTTTAGRQVTISATVQVPSAGNAPMTKVSPDASSLSTSPITFHWEAGDKVVLLSNDYEEAQLFTIVDASINGATANFTGTALTDMTSYRVAYYGKNTSIQRVIELEQGGIDSLSYEANNFHPYIGGSGNAGGFTLDNFTAVINIPLKGDATIGKIDFYYKNSENFILATNLSFETGLSLSDVATPVYMPLASLSSIGFIIKIYDTDNQLLLEKIVNSSVLADNYGKLVTFPALEVNAALPEGALSGVFTVDASGTKVRFSKGNMYYNGTAFKFEDNQYSSATDWDESHVSHFYWSKTASVAYAETYSDSGTSGSDVFFTNANTTTPNTNFTVNGSKGVWRTLTIGEWQYLLNTRSVNKGSGEGKSYQRATINSDATGVYGLIIYPDNYTSQTTATSYTSAEWTAMESAGCVFLSAAGGRDCSNVYDVGEFGYYWSSTASDGSYAYDLYFDSDSVSLDDCSTRDNGFSVRLVCAAQ